MISKLNPIAKSPLKYYFEYFAVSKQQCPTIAIADSYRNTRKLTGTVNKSKMYFPPILGVRDEEVEVHRKPDCGHSW